MRTLGAFSEYFETRTIAGHDVPEMIGEMAQIELSQGGKSWAQLYAAMALQSLGTDLNRNALWQSLTPEGRQSYRSLLDPGRFYDQTTHTLINLPENYFGVAARIAAIDYQLGLNNDRTALDDLLNRAAKQFTDGALFADDALPTGRYDRYSNEYTRGIYDAAELAGRQDIMKAVAPSLQEQMKPGGTYSPRMVRLLLGAKSWGNQLYGHSGDRRFSWASLRVPAGAASSVGIRPFCCLVVVAKRLQHSDPLAVSFRFRPRRLCLHHPGTRVATDHNLSWKSDQCQREVHGSSRERRNEELSFTTEL